MAKERSPIPDIIKTRVGKNTIKIPIRIPTKKKDLSRPQIVPSVIYTPKPQNIDNNMPTIRIRDKPIKDGKLMRNNPIPKDIRLRTCKAFLFPLNSNLII